MNKKSKYSNELGQTFRYLNCSLFLDTEKERIQKRYKNKEMM